MTDVRNERDGDRPCAPTTPADAGAITQVQIARLRGRLLGGRGPGATRQETARYMRERATVGAVPTVIERELVQISTDFARDDADALARGAERTRDNLRLTLDALGTRLAPRRLTAQAIEVGRVRCALMLGARTGTGAPLPAEAVGNGEDKWWWRVAVRAAAAGVASTVGLGLLIRTARRRWVRHDNAAGLRTGTSRGSRPRQPVR